MSGIEDRTTASYKFKERDFYVELWINNTTIKEHEQTLQYSVSSKDRDYAEKEIARLKFEKQVAIDEWKEKHGQYEADMVNWTLAEASEKELEGKGLSALQKRYDDIKYWHIHHEEENEEEFEY